MSPRPEPIPVVPEETVRVARAAFPKGNLYVKVRDEPGTSYKDEDFADLFPNARNAQKIQSRRPDAAKKEFQPCGGAIGPTRGMLFNF